MIIPLLLAATLTCPQPVIVNNTRTWTEQDKLTFEFAKTRCPEIYKDAPCLTFFRKKAENVYNVICGPAK